ncbi:MAG: thiolase family protein [Alphaproteobacteria bacterium]|nr:thiolase family protein [Alphaproteobacteria bacterium]MCB9791162.1 thiolase family protein [Alphaproteobacteria bacterium]
MHEVYVIGVGATAFGKWPDRGFRALAREAVTAALADARLPSPGALGGAWFGNCGMSWWGQHNVRGQGVLAPLKADGTLPRDLPIANVEGGCATGSLALAGAVNAVRAEGGAALAVGVEKTLMPHDPAGMFNLFAHGIDQRHPDEWQAALTEQAAAHRLGWSPHPQRVVFLDIHALRARRHMQRYGTSPEALARIAARAHANGAANPRARLRFTLSPEDVLADKPVVAPFTRAMCAPLSDGAAAAVVCDGDTLATLPDAVRRRALRVRALALAGGAPRDLDAPGVIDAAAARAWARAGLGPGDIDVVEVHDATAFCEIEAVEALGFCAPGEGAALCGSAASSVGGALPVNPSGGLVSCGHPLAATGLGMVYELALQLRAEAGPRQVAGARIGLAENAGGSVGVDEALCAVLIVEAVG